MRWYKLDYLENRTKKVQKLHNIYSEEKEIPDVIKKLVEIKMISNRNPKI